MCAYTYPSLVYYRDESKWTTNIADRSVYKRYPQATPEQDMSLITG